METIQITSKLNKQITHWKIKGSDFEKIYKRTTCNTPDSTVNRVRNLGFKGEVVVTGLTMHAETKPVFLAEII